MSGRGRLAPATLSGRRPVYAPAPRIRHAAERRNPVSLPLLPPAHTAGAVLHDNAEPRTRPRPARSAGPGPRRRPAGPRRAGRRAARPEGEVRHDPDAARQRQDASADPRPRVTLLDTLREHLALTGAKKGCDQGQ